MDDLRKEQAKLAQKASYDKAMDSVDAMIEALTRTRNSIVSDPSTAGFQLAKAKQPIKKHFDDANDNLKQVNSALRGYEKALSRTFRTPFEDNESDVLSSQTYLINRALAMHLLREGQFNVASTFIQETNELNDLDAACGIRSPDPNTSSSARDLTQSIQSLSSVEHEWEAKSEALQQQFTIMYDVLGELRENHNLDPAIIWARENSAMLEHRGSNLEFELCRLRYVNIFCGQDSNGMADSDVLMNDAHADVERILKAGAYARETFANLPQRHASEINKLVGAMAFYQNVPDSPYAAMFATDTAWDEVATSFTKEFCSLLGLSAASPLYIACTAGAIALPVLTKVKNIMRAKRTEWTSAEELPVEVPLPPAYRYHSIFVCPVSKEQATDANPPMMLQCGHVLANESLKNISRGARFKCPYCPMESSPRDAKKVYL